MRGLPGSGKSSVSRAVTELLAAEGGAVTCSADHFFERGGVLSEAELAGLGARERYRAAFRTNLLGEAHAQCRAAFDASPLLRLTDAPQMLDNLDYASAQHSAHGKPFFVGLGLRACSFPWPFPQRQGVSAS